MKRRGFTFGASLIIMLTAITMSFFSSCEGPAGVAGEDANESCTQCHNEDTDVLAAMLQHSNAGHQMGTSFERNGTSCAPCHTHQGFLHYVATGERETESDVSNPLPVNCRTCHMIHENFDSTDFELRSTSPIDMRINNVEVDLGTGNQCVECHQARVPEPLPVVGNGGNVSITSNRWGPHHGPQSNILYGTGAFEVSGSESYSSPGSHAHTSAGCNGCHMAEPFGAFAGGHSFSMTYEYHGHEVDLVSGCSGCHSDIEDFDLNNTQTEIASLLEELETILIDQGYLNGESGLVNATSSEPLQISTNQAGALLNYYMVSEDRSMGIHNPKYVQALLQNSIEVFN